MNAQILTTPVMTCRFAVALAETDSPLEEPIFASSRDYGFDFDEEELGNELLDPLSVSLADQPNPKVDADEFEKVFQYFLS
jgi:hypothetical protein